MSRRWTSIGLVLVYALVGIGAGALSATASAATSDDWYELRAADVTANPEAAAQRLTAAGVKAEVYAVPAVASAVGRFAIVEVAGDRCQVPGEREMITRLATIRRSADMAVLRLSPSLLRESEGRFVFNVGRAATAGEQPVLGGSAPGLAASAPGLPSLESRLARVRACDGRAAGAKARRGQRSSRNKARRPGRVARG